MVRPRKAPAMLRVSRLPAPRVTAAERGAVETVARATGLPIAEIVRRAVLGRPVAPRRPAIDEAAMVALTRIGNNINQLARAANSGLAPAAPELREALAASRAVLKGLADGA